MTNLPSDKESRRKAGVTTIFIVFAMSALIGIAALAVDAGYLYAARGQLQNSADAAALAAAQDMFGTDGAIDRTAGIDAAVALANLHRAAEVTNVVLDPSATPSDILFGDWDEELRTFTAIAPGALNQGDVDSVSVLARLDDTPNAKVPALLSKVRGKTDFATATRATAYIGYAGVPGPGDVDIPIVVDCCAIDACPDSDPSTSYCSGGIPPTTNSVGCDLVRPQADGQNTSLSCLDFAPTGSQNACWTVFDNGASVNANDLRDLVNTGSYDGGTVPEPVAGELYNLDNGTKSPVLRAIMRRFEGFPGWTSPLDPSDPDWQPPEDPVAAEGTDAYPPFDGRADQWFKILPVFECQNGVDQCATGNNQKLLGFVCTEIREIEAPDDHNFDPLNDGDKKVRLNFVCPTLPGGAPNPQISNCQLNGGGTVPGGGANFGLKATIPVLVQ